MNPKLTSKKLLSYISSNKNNKYKFKSRPQSCPIAFYLRERCGYSDVVVDEVSISYTNTKGEDVYIDDSDRHAPKWLWRFVSTFDDLGFNDAKSYLQSIVKKVATA